MWRFAIIAHNDDHEESDNDFHNVDDEKNFDGFPCRKNATPSDS